MHSVWIGLGSNLENPVVQVKRAIQAFSCHDWVSLVATSSLYRSAPQGPCDQPNFINAVVHLKTGYDPYACLSLCQKIEEKFGRVRKRHWGERIIDCDILLFDQAVISSPELTVPHTRLTERDFVLLPLLELDPNLRLPDGRLLADVQSSVQTRIIEKIIT